MRIQGKIWKTKNNWVLQIPSMDLVTKGKTRKEAVAMLKSSIQTLRGKSFSVRMIYVDHHNFYLTSDKIKKLVAFILFRLRAKQGLSLEDVRKRLGVKSKNAYAQYEQGRAEPTISKMEELLKALDCSLVLNAG